MTTSYKILLGSYAVSFVILLAVSARFIYRTRKQNKRPALIALPDEKAVFINTKNNKLLIVSRVCYTSEDVTFELKYVDTLRRK